MKKIRVKPIFGAHQIYQEIVNYPPKDIEYIGVTKDTKAGKYYENKKWKERINRIAQKLSLPRMILIRPNKFDIIHSSRGIIPLQFFSNKPWVMDIEQFTSFTGLHYDLMKKNKLLRQFIEKRLASKNCKAILCHCEATKKAFFKHMNCKKFENKLKVLYPSSHLIEIPKKNNKNKIIILSVNSIFEQKGGLFILEAFSRLEKKYKNVELWIKADVPKKIKEKYNTKKIKYIGYSTEIIPREELIKNLYSKADIFVYPTFCDSFGYSLIDALVAGIPIVATNLFAVPEIVKNERNGLIVNIPGYKLEQKYIQEHNVNSLTEKEKEAFIRGLEQKIEKLIVNKQLREKMGKESFKLISEGKFSIKERNKKLRKVYEEALK